MIPTHKSFSDVKRIFTSFVCVFAVYAAADAQPRCGVSASYPQADTVLLSADVEGTCLVRTYLVRQHADRNSGYAVRYRVGAAQLSSPSAGNVRQLDDLQAFLDKIAQDSSLQVTGVTITGHASPDGPYVPNERLARKRAADLREYVGSRYLLPADCPVAVSAVVDEWRTAIPAVEASAIPSKLAVLRILSGSDEAAVKEMRLKQLPAAWDYMRRHILPPMRHVEMAVAYDECSIVTERTPIPLPEVERAVYTTYVIVDDQPDGLIIDMDALDCPCPM